MDLKPGDKLGPYEIVSPLGKGGMGEVWRARDPRLGREVAIKVSADQFTDRFEKEARAIAALNHPNICTLFDVGPNYLVMELIEGLTLGDRIHEGAIPLEEALTITRQIADALEAAHEKGIVHRDLKPGNVKIRPDGSVKVLDFGLAKAVFGESRVTNDSPTLMQMPTQMGVILGTAAYMSPEQARGKEVDKRADIWSFGVVLYEMLTGSRPFHGTDMSEILASVIKEQPSFESVPNELRRLIAKCLQKDPAKRLRDIGDVWELLDQSRPSIAGTAPVQRAAKPLLPWAVAAVLAVAAAGLAVLAASHLREEPPQVVRLSLLPPENSDFAGSSIPAISPDGRQLVFGATVAGKTSLWVRDLSAASPRLLHGTEESQYPFWSPDGRAVAFFSGNKLKRMDIAGGTAITVCGFQGQPRGGAWGGDTIVFGISGDAGGALYRVPAGGGAVSVWLKPDVASGEALLRWPSFLPDGRHFFYSANNRDTEKVAIHVGDLTSGTHQRIMMPAASNAVFSAGRMLFVRDTTLLAQAFDPGTLRLSGEAVPIAEDLAYGVNSLQFQFSASRGGALVFAAGTNPHFSH